MTDKFYPGRATPKLKARVNGLKLRKLQQIVRTCNKIAGKELFVGFFPFYWNTENEYVVVCLSMPYHWDNKTQRMYSNLEKANRELNLKFLQLYGKRYCQYRDNEGIYVS